MASLIAQDPDPAVSLACPSRALGVAFDTDGDWIVRNATAGPLGAISKMPRHLPDPRNARPSQLAQIWNQRELTGVRPHIRRDSGRPTVRIVDLFCGCGGLSLGFRRAAEAVGVRAVFTMAVDVFRPALEVYAQNLRPVRTARRNVATLVESPSTNDEDTRSGVGPHVYLDASLESLRGTVDILLAGPPCEGNSNLNNRTRRSDPRNDLYYDVVLAGIALKARVIVVENVPSVVSANQNVVARARAALDAAGYRVAPNDLVLKASNFGTPQDRRRHFLIAAQSGRSIVRDDFLSLRVQAPTALEALAPLSDISRNTPFDMPSKLSEENRRRVEFLFRSGRHDLPNRERPDCHRLKDHNYLAIYGRIHPDRPAPTITTGFLSPGRGRFTHPTQARSLTPHEGARLQGFGEDFNWLEGTDHLTRSDYANMIGAAVPPQLGFAVGLGALSLL